MSDARDQKTLSPNEGEDSLVIPTDEEGNISTKDIVKNLRERLKTCEKEKGEYLLGWQRSKADFINARKDEERERSEFAKFAREIFIRELLPVLDNFQLAFANKEVWESAPKNWRDGVEYIHKTFISILKDHGLSEMEPLGQKFDANLHEGVTTVPAENKDADGLITKVMRKGYFLNGKLIRPAHVEYKEFKKNN